MNKTLSLIALAAAALAAAPSAEACTSLIAARGATTDGSTMITYAADSHVLYGELYHQAAADHAPGSMRVIKDWDTGVYRGEIPEVAHTYATIGNMNEHGLAISESTWGGRPELEGSGIVDYGSLIYIALQRATTAREAITVMTSLVRDYGYASEGESFSIADASEVWIMEMIGKGKADKGAVWVARRIPDNCISGHANHARIHRFPLDEPQTTLYSPDVISFAREQGYYSGTDADFDFSKAYAITDFGALRGCDARVWSYFNRFSDGGVDAYLTWIDEGRGEPMPLWIEPSRKLSADDLKWMMRDHFEGTPYDMTKDIGAGPFDVPYRWRPMTFTVDSVEYTNERAIATQQTGFSFVASVNASRPEAMRGILWFGVDDANTCVYVPVFNSTPEPPHQLAPGNGDMLTLSWDAMFWVNNYVANQAYNRYSQMIGDIRAVQSALEEGITTAVAKAQTDIAAMPYAQAQATLADVTNYWTAKATSDYKSLGDKLLVKYLDGNIKQEKDGQFVRTPEGMCARPTFGGYNERYYRSIVNECGDHLRVKKY
ncbi:MAG: C69 family dipeptidase [Muribaculaceae bacterium]